MRLVRIALRLAKCNCSLARPCSVPLCASLPDTGVAAEMGEPTSAAQQHPQERKALRFLWLSTCHCHFANCHPFTSHAHALTQTLPRDCTRTYLLPTAVSSPTQHQMPLRDILRKPLSLLKAAGPTESAEGCAGVDQLLSLCSRQRTPPVPKSAAKGAGALGLRGVAAKNLVSRREYEHGSWQPVSGEEEIDTRASQTSSRACTEDKAIPLSMSTGVEVSDSALSSPLPQGCDQRETGNGSTETPLNVSPTLWV
jgi:hypothetical protein